jgi:uncharacterized protein (DUF2252 family)
MQQRFSEMLDLSQTPCVFLHGNPHIDNFVKTSKIEAMIDFDRSRFGPYSWDLVRFASSLSIRREEMTSEFLNHKVMTHLKESYVEAFTNPYKHHLHSEVMPQIQPSNAELSTKAYLAANLNWAQKMRENPIFRLSWRGTLKAAEKAPK